MIYTEEESISGWINRNEQVIIMECFHNLDIDVIKAGIKVLHRSALLFFEKADIKEALLMLVSKFAILKNTSALKMGKLTNNLVENNEVEYTTKYTSLMRRNTQSILL